MTAVYRAYTSTDEAEDAIERLLAASVPETDIKLIMGVAIKDARDKPIGTWAGTTTPDDLTVGTYANTVRSGRAAMGTFAGDPDQKRRGAFSDVDRDTVTTYRAGVRRTRIVSRHQIEQLLVAGGPDRASAQAHVKALHAGRAVVLIPDELSPAALQPPLRAAA